MGLHGEFFATLRIYVRLYMSHNCK